ncbi:MAG: hypothetical protein ACYDFU_09160, partial [Nitrospirota bacterium]
MLKDMHCVYAAIRTLSIFSLDHTDAFIVQGLAGTLCRPLRLLQVFYPGYAFSYLHFHASRAYCLLINLYHGEHLSHTMFIGMAGQGAS